MAGRGLNMAVSVNSTSFRNGTAMAAETSTKASATAST